MVVKQWKKKMKIKDKISNFFIAKLFKGAAERKNDLSTYDIVYPF